MKSAAARRSRESFAKQNEHSFAREPVATALKYARASFALSLSASSSAFALPGATDSSAQRERIVGRRSWEFSTQRMNITPAGGSSSSFSAAFCA